MEGKMFAHSKVLIVWIVAYVCVWNGINGQLISKHRQVTMSSQFDDWSGERVVDGNYNTDADACHCCAATTNETDPWINVDLGDTYMISRIRVYSRTDGHPLQNLNGLTFRLDGNTVAPKRKKTSDLIRAYNFILDKPTSARNVSLVLPGAKRTLTLCEFDVYNTNIISTNKPVSMSSNYSDWVAERAVDGNNSTDGNNCNCCAAGKLQEDAWLRVDLTDYYYINYIIIKGRTDDQPPEQRLGGMIIQFGDTVVQTVPNSTTNHYEFGSTRMVPVRNLTLTVNGTSVEKRTLVVCELIVYGERVIAVSDRVISSGKSVNLSSTYLQWTGEKAVDGRSDTNTPETCRCCAATDYEDTTWLRVDLKEYYYITFVVIEGRTDKTYPGQSFAGMTIKLGDELVDTVPESSIDVSYYQVAVSNVYPVKLVQLTLHGTPAQQAQLVVCELVLYGDCLPYYYGNCSLRCGHCYKNATCNRVNGTCEKCAAGYTETDKICKTVCPNGTYGHNCTEMCGKCRNGVSCNQIDGACEHCEDGYSESDRTCKTPCPDGTYGQNCSRLCGHCIPGKNCNKTNGICEQCEAGYLETDMMCVNLCPNGTYGNNCTKTCGQCRNDASCNQSSGICDQCENGYMYTETDRTCKTPCSNGTYGHNCTETCGQCRDGASCNKTDGICDGCEDGYIVTDLLCADQCPNGTYGKNCTEECGLCRESSTCNFKSGTCEACENGYDGTDLFCKSTCPDKTYGNNCSSDCGECRDNEVCNKTDGRCTACKDGYNETDFTCKTECVGGRFGGNCEQSCGHCKNGSSCDHVNGSCVQWGCSDGFIGELCIELLKADDDDNPVGVVAGSVIGVIVIVAVAIGGVFFIKRRRLDGKKTEQKYEQNHIRDHESTQHFNQAFEDDADDDTRAGDNDTYYNLVPKTSDVRIFQLWNYIYQKKRNNAEALKKQFKEIAEHVFPTNDALTYRYKVRYKDMLPYDQTRVHLDVEEEGECEFINASHVHGFDRQNKFIASQGPMDVMVMDFWRMVWQQDTKKIVMLTNLIETGSKKCIQYWPESGAITYERIQVSLVKEESTTDYVIRTLELKQDQSRPKRVQQFHYKAWPDKDVPDSAWSLILFWREVFKDGDKSSAPVVVHCSAGVGRTGTFIALDNLYHQALQTGSINAFEIVSQLRQQRLKMVQTQDQYVYLHDAVAEALLIGTHFIWQSQFEGYYDYMIKMDKDASKTRLHKQFQLLQDSLKQRGVERGRGESSKHNIYANSEINEYRPKSQARGNSILVTFGGSIVENYAGKNSFILMKLPHEKQKQEFWELLDDNNIKTVVTLMEHGDASTKLWSSTKAAKHGTKGPYTPVLVGEDNERNLSIRTYEYTKEHKLKEGEKGVVRHFELITSKSSLPEREPMVTALQHVYQWHKYLSQSEQILIQCSDGVTQSGLMCVLLNEVARMLMDDGHINVLESVTLMKQSVPGIIPDFVRRYAVNLVLSDHHKAEYNAVYQTGCSFIQEDQYKYIHDVILDMVTTKDEEVDLVNAEEACIYENMAANKL